MKKILSILACVCVLLSLMVVGTVSAEETTATVEKAITATTGVLASDSESISWDAETFTFVTAKAGSTNAIRVTDTDHFRAYKGSETTITAKSGKITKIVITATSAEYATALEGFTFAEGISAAADGTTVTLTVAGGAEAVEIVAGAQWRLSKIAVTTATGGGNTGSAAAAASEIVLTVDSLGLASNSYSADTATVDKVSFEWVQLGNYGDGIQVRDKNDNTSTLWNTSAFPAAIKEIKLTYSSTKDVSYANADAEIFSFGNEAGTYGYSTKLSTTAGVKEYTITPDAETYTFFKFEHDLGYTMYWDSITIVLVAAQNGNTGDGNTGDDTDEGGGNTGDDNEIPATLAEQIAQANGLANSEHLPYESTITGTITDDPYASNYTEGQYKFTVSDGTNTLLCYYVPVTGGIPAKGDTVTVTGKLTAYNGAAQFDSTAAAVVTAVGGDEGDGNTGDDEDDNTGSDDAADLGAVDTVEAGKAYKFGMIQENKNDGLVYYLTGEMNGYYMDTTTDAASAIDVYLEETTGGYYLYTTDGTTKTYINMVVSGTHVNGAYEAAASTVYTYDADAKTLVADVDGAPYWFGTRNDMSYTTVGPCKTEYEGFYCQFYAAVEENTGDDDDDTTGSDNGSNNDGNKDEDKPSSPVTGDTTNVLFVALSVISVAAILLCASKKRALN